VDSSFIIIIV